MVSLRPEQARKRQQKLLTAASITLLGGLLLAACNAVLGIGEASLDPTFTPDAGTTTSSSSGMGGGMHDAGTGGAGGGTGGAGGGDPNTCAHYCDVINKNCTGANAEYLTKQVCLDMCNTFDPGQPGDMMNDSLACRLYWAKQADKDPATYCQLGGPLAGKCTTPCSAFCLLDYDLCNAGGLFPYKDSMECKMACAGFNYLGSADAGPGTVGDILFSTGDTLNCRLYHLESAWDKSNPMATTTHCPHTALVSAACN
jgi:hypothetical protein